MYFQLVELCGKSSCGQLIFNKDQQKCDFPNSFAGESTEITRAGVERENACGTGVARAAEETV